jgi:hypothetical protein
VLPFVGRLRSLPLDLPAVPVQDRSPEISPADEALIRALLAVYASLSPQERAASDRRLLRPTDPAWRDLRDALQHFARDAKARGESPEQTLLHLKRLMADAVPVFGRETALRAAVIRTCISAYFYEG